MKQHLILASLVSIAPALAGSAAFAQEAYKIGVATGQTGYLAVTDGPALKGLQLGVDEINAAGGIDGRWPIELDIRNTNSEPAQTATVTQQLIDAGANMILTPCDLDPSVAGGQIAQRAQIPAISLCASTPTLPELVGDYMFSSWYGDNVTGYTLAKYAIEQGYETAWLHEFSRHRLYDQAARLFRNGLRSAWRDGDRTHQLYARPAGFQRRPDQPARVRTRSPT